MRAPMGNVFCTATPVGDPRFQAPHAASHNFPALRVAGGPDRQPWLPDADRGGHGWRPGFQRADGGAPNVARLRTFLAERFPLLKDAPINEQRACHYESTVSRNFIIDKHRT
ncbi:MAG: hypothetical protein IPK85_15240 [Gemmatimonadetes bacterium]|nr:hypothetical protein [Gemmatimonadota bacterium]